MNEQLKLLPNYFGLLMPLKQWAKKEIVVLSKAILLTSEGKVGCYSTMEMRKYV